LLFGGGRVAFFIGVGKLWMTVAATLMLRIEEDEYAKKIPGVYRGAHS